MRSCKRERCSFCCKSQNKGRCESAALCVRHFGEGGLKGRFGARVCVGRAEEGERAKGRKGEGAEKGDGGV